MTSKRDENWKKLLFDQKSKVSSSFQEWLEDDTITCFQINSEAFKHMGFNPRTMIPLYHKDQLPLPLKERGLELFRNQVGGCVITKTGKPWRYPTLFPSFPECKIVESTPFEPIDHPTILFRKEVYNESTAFFLAQRMGVLMDFLADVNSSVKDNPLEHCGRLQGNVSGKIKIGNEILQVEKALFELDHSLENDHIIVLVELKGKFHPTMSIHQLLLPYLFLRKLENRRDILLVYFITKKDKKNDIKKQHEFRLHLLEFKTEKEDNIPIATEYQFRKSNHYIIRP